MADMDPKAINDLANAVDRLTKTFESFSRVGVSMGSNLSSIEKKMLDVAKAIGKSKKNIDKEEKALKNVDKALDLLSKTASYQQKELDKMGIADQKMVKAMLSNSKSALLSLKRDHQRRIEDNQKAINEMIAQEKKLNSTISKENKKRPDLDKKDVKTKAYSWGRSRRRDPFGYLETTPKTKIEMMRKGGAATGVIKDISQMFGRSFPKSQASFNPFTAAKRYYQSSQAMKSGASQLSQWKHVTSTGARVAKAKAIGGGGKQFAVAAKGLSALSGALGGLLKVLPVIGIITSVVSALTGLVKAVVNADDFISKLNRRFLELAGPAIGLTDISRYMKEFNKEVYNLRRNLKLGLKAQDVQEMFGALSAAGMSLQGVKQNVGSYGKVVYNARVLSLEFGTSIQDMGKMIGENMINLRSSLDNVGDSFRKMAFDATKAGISSQKFYQIVESATSSLSYFGNFLKTGSGLLKSFYKAGELGLRDAETAVSGIMGAFKGIDYKKGLKVLGTMGKEAVESVFGELTLIDRKNLDNLKNELDEKLRIDTSGMNEKERLALADSITSLRTQIESSEAKTERLSKALSAYKAGSPEELSLQIGRLAEAPIKPLMKIMSLGNNYTLAEIELLGNILGMSQEQVVFLKGTLDRTRDSFVKFTEGNRGIFDAIKGNEGATNALVGMVDKLQAGGSGAELMSEMFEALKSSGLDEKSIKMLMSDLNEQVENGMVSATKSFLNILGKGGDTANVFENMTDYVAKAVEGRDDIMGKTAQETNDWLKDVVGKITSAKDYYDITKENAAYFIQDPIVSGFKLLTTIVADILGHVTDIANIFRKEKGEKVESLATRARDILTSKSGKEKEVEGIVKDFREDFIKSMGASLTEEQALSLMEGKGLFETGISGVDPDKYSKFFENFNKATTYSVGLGTAGTKGSIYTKLNDSISKQSQELDQIGEEMAKKGHHMTFQDILLKKGEATPPPSKGPSDFRSLTTSFVSSLNQKQDFKATRGGLALLNRNDLVFRPPQAAGVAGGSGDFTPQLMKDLFASSTLKGGGTKSIKYEVNLGGLTVQGDASDPAVMQKIAENLGVMINQAISKRERESQMAGG